LRDFTDFHFPPISLQVQYLSFDAQIDALENIKEGSKPRFEIPLLRDYSRKPSTKFVFFLASTRLFRMNKLISKIFCIKDEVDRFLVKDEEIKNRCRAYFDKLFNDESEKNTIELDDSIDTNRRFVRRIQESEVKEALKR
jgi:hypothetical protein